MTRPYLESTFVSSSSMGGSMMPLLSAMWSSFDRRAIRFEGLFRAKRRKVLQNERWGGTTLGPEEFAGSGGHQVYDLAGRFGDVGVHDGRVELLLGRQLDLR